MAVSVEQYNQMNRPFPGQAPKPAKKDLDKDAFMQLFVAQLKNQDPLNPMSNKESMAQMAQMSQLEQLTNLNTSLQGIASQLKVQQTLDAANLIGKSVLASGNDIAKEGDAVSGAIMTVPAGVTKIKVNIHDSAGNIISTVDVPNVKAGKMDFKWDGNKADGTKAVDGQYKMSIVAENNDGRKFMVKTQIEGTVKGVEVENGRQVLTLADGRKVLLDAVWRIVNPTTGNA